MEYNASCPVSVGDIMEIETSDGTHQIPVAGLLSYTPFSKVEGEENVICSEALFQKFTGERRYTIIDIQLTRDASDQDVEELRAMTDSNMTFSDQRMSNNEVRGAYYSFSMFVYGFLAIIALIAVFNVVNGIAMSVSARMKEYGAMRAIGMSPGQLTRMIAAETVVYVGGGVFIGCAAGLPLNWLLYNSAISSRWGTPWPLPAISLLVILAFVILAAVVAVVGPSRRLKEMSAADTVNRE